MFSQLVERESWEQLSSKLRREIVEQLVEPSLGINCSNFLLVYNQLILFLSCYKLSNGF
jgi:hypothetical protein